MPDLIDALRAHLGREFGPQCVGHALDHLDRVYRLADEISRHEGGDLVVLTAASYLHDYHRVVEREGRADEAIVEARIVDALEAVAFPGDRFDAVLSCIAFTDRYSFAGHALKASSLEAKIVRDADNLDAIGAVGIARAFMFGGHLGEPLWVAGVAPETTYRSGITSSVIHHFFEKLLLVRDDMLTSTGRALANARHDYMLDYLTRLQSEWNDPWLAEELCRHQQTVGPGTR